jgi:hypothetical protein
VSNKRCERTWLHKVGTLLEDARPPGIHHSISRTHFVLPGQNSINTSTLNSLMGLLYLGICLIIYRYSPMRPFYCISDVNLSTNQAMPLFPLINKLEFTLQLVFFYPTNLHNSQNSNLFDCVGKKNDCSMCSIFFSSKTQMRIGWFVVSSANAWKGFTPHTKLQVYRSNSVRSPMLESHSRRKTNESRL